MKYVLVIPALDPPEKLTGYIDELLENGFSKIILVDDGSRDKAIFDALKDKGIHVLTHEKNLGKGAALKSAFKCYKQNYSSDFSGVITLDSDGQHLCKDVIKVQKALDMDLSKLVIGSRDFSMPCVPPKSKFGNNLTRHIFRFLLHINIGDTQTGLRGIPNSLIDTVTDIPGDRFEYETAMLIKIGRSAGIVEVPIETVYLDENKGTHFNPIKDSIKIYAVVFGALFK